MRNEGLGKAYQENTYKKKGLISDKVECRPMGQRHHKGKMMKMIVFNVHVLNNTEATFLKQRLYDVKGKTDRHTLINGVLIYSSFHTEQVQKLVRWPK